MKRFYTSLAFLIVLFVLGGTGFFMVSEKNRVAIVEETSPRTVSFSSEEECEDATQEGCMMSLCYFGSDETTQTEACGEDFVAGWVPMSSDMAKRNPQITIKHGDTFGAMKVVSIQPFSDRGSFSSPATPSNVRIRLAGSILVTGTYAYEVSGIGFAGACMSDFDVSSLAAITNLQTAARDSYKGLRTFCFQDDEKIKQELAPYDGKKITVEIDEYVYAVCECETVDRARFVRIVE